jgi:hypothetical protein
MKLAGSRSELKMAQFDYRTSNSRPDLNLSRVNNSNIRGASDACVGEFTGSRRRNSALLCPMRARTLSQEQVIGAQPIPFGIAIEFDAKRLSSAQTHLTIDRTADRPAGCRLPTSS